MTNTAIIQEANRLVKDANFTKIVKRTKIGRCLTFMAGKDFDLLASYTSKAIYVSFPNGELGLLR